MEAAGDYMLIGLDEKAAKRSGMPPKIPVPKADFEQLADKGITVEAARGWVRAFLANPATKTGAFKKDNLALLASLEAFIAKTEFLDKAQKAFEKDDFAGAVTALKMATRVDVNDHASRMSLAAALANSGNYEAALKELAAVQATFAGDAEYHVAVGHAELALGKREQSAESFALALEADPSNRGALSALVKLGVLIPVYEDAKDATSLTYVRSNAVIAALEEAWSSADRDAAFYLSQLQYHEVEGRHDVALAAADRALAATPTPEQISRAKSGRLAALRALGRGAETESEARAVLADDENATWARVELAGSLLTRGARDEAIVELDRALKSDPSDQLALVMRFWPNDRNSLTDVQAAIPALEAFTKEHPNAAGAVRSLARAKAIIGDQEGAFDLFAKATALAPNDDELRAEYWNELGKERKFQRIVDDAATVQDLAKRDWKLRWNEAEAYVGLGKRLEGRASFAAINFDSSLPVEIRKRAKKAVESIDTAGKPAG